MSNLIVLAGKARTGKDTVAEYLAYTYSYRALALATPLKQAVRIIHGLTDAETANEYTKETTIARIGKSPRQLWQQTSDVLKEAYGQDLWVRRLNDECQRLWEQNIHTKIVVSDARFDLEVDWARSMGASVWHVVRDDASVVNTHRSENGVTRQNGDFVLANNGTIAELYAHIDRLLPFAE